MNRTSPSDSPSAGRRMRSARRLVAALAAALVCHAAAADDGPRKALRVCQDPNNLPFSNTKGEGIENRIAELFGKELGLPVTYYSFPQRMGFVRNTLRYKLPGQDYPCDIIMGVPVGFEQADVTKPYYRSTYALVLSNSKGLDKVDSVEAFLRLDPAVLKSLKIGVFDRSPASAWLDRHGLVDQGVPYLMLSPDPDQYPGELIERELAAGKIDAAIVWGPIAGFYAKRATTKPLKVILLKSEPGVKFDYAMAMGVRRGEPQWKQQIESLIERKQPEIEAILRDYGVPLVDAQGNPLPR